MDISIVAGKYSEINNAQIFEILKSRDKTKKHIIIAPDRSLFSLEERLFDELQESCFFDVSVMSMSKFASNLLKTNTKKILTKQSGVALVKKILMENQDKLSTFSKATRYMGFASSLFETICLFKSCNISCEEMCVDNDNYSSLKQKDIKLVYGEYEKFLKNDYTDSFNQLKLFADLINSDFCKNTCFYFVEFDDFTSLMYLIISKLAKFSEKFYITCTYSKGTNANIYTNKVYFDLIDLFKLEGLTYNLIKPENKNLLAENLLAYRPNKLKEENNITINSFENINDEIKYTIADINRKVSNITNINYGDFAIVLPSFLTYKKLIKNELGAYKIPAYFDENQILSEHAFIRLLFDMCNLLNGQFLGSDYLQVIKNKILGFDDEEVLKIDDYIKLYNCKGLMCIKYPNTTDSKLIDFGQKLLTWKTDTKKYETIEDFYNNIILDIYNYISLNLDTYIQNISPIEKRIFSQVLDKFESIGEDFVRVFGKDKMSFEEFEETYKSYFESTNISLPPITSNTLFVADFESSYVSNYKYIYVLGCSEGKLPSFKIDNGILTDEDIARLPNAKKINPTISLINKRKTFKLFDLVFRAKDKLILSFAYANGEGKLYPNSLVKSIVNILDIEFHNGSFDLDIINNSLDTLNLENICFNNQNESQIISNILLLTKNWDIYNSYPNFRTILSLLVDVYNKKEIYSLIDNNADVVKDIRLKNINLLNKDYTSVSQIETYFACPYKHFARYGLGLNIKKNYEIKPNDIGTIIHRVLKCIVPYILDGETIQVVLTKANIKFHKILEEDEYSAFIKNPINIYIIKSLEKELNRIVEAIINQINLSSYKPNKKYLEYRFVTSQIIDGIKIKGSIDRVDVWGDNFIIIDYKTGDSNFDDYTEVASGKKLQLLVYAKEFEQESKFKPCGVFYLPISNALKKQKDSGYKFIGVADNDKNNLYAIDNSLSNCSTKSTILNLSTTQSGEFVKNSGFFSRMCIDQNDMQFLLDFAIKQVNFAIKNIMEGDITPQPLKLEKKLSCDNCEFKGLCGYLGNNDRVVSKVSTVEDLKNRGKY